MPKNVEYAKPLRRECSIGWTKNHKKKAHVSSREWSSLDELEGWYVHAHRQRSLDVVPADRTHKADLRHVFDELTKDWKTATWHLSSIKKRIAHPSYRKITGMGREALPFIFEDLRKGPALWFWALEAITREDVCPECTSMTKLREAWLAWAEANGY